MATKKNNKGPLLRLITVDGIQYKKSPGRPRRRHPLRNPRAMHRKKLLYGQVLPFPAKRFDQVRPMGMSDTLPLLTLPQGPHVDRGVLGHGSDRWPAGKNVRDGLHIGLIPLDYTSSKVKLKLPVTIKVGRRTICPMSRVNTPTQFKKGFCQRLAAARTMAGLEQADIAKALGITPNTYSKYESRTLMPHHLIPVACEILEIEMPYLYGAVTRRSRKASGDLHAS